MNTLLIVAPVLVGMLILLYIILANVLRLWLDHRVKMVLLEKLRRDPDAPGTMEEIQSLLDADETDAPRKSPVDYVIVGTILAALGLGTAGTAYLLGQGQASVGVYFGGVACVTVGAILILLGLLIRYLTRLPVHKNMK